MYQHGYWYITGRANALLYLGSAHNYMSNKSTLHELSQDA